MIGSIRRKKGAGVHSRYVTSLNESDMVVNRKGTGCSLWKSSAIEKFQSSNLFQSTFLKVRGTFRVSTVHRDRSESPAVEERVVHSGAHGDDVRAEKREQKVRRLVEIVEIFGREYDDVERQPATDEDRHHRYQHAVRASLALDFRLITSAPAATQQS